MDKLTNMRRWLEEGEEATKLYYFELYTGERGESDSALCLFDLLCEPSYSDCDDRATHIMMLGKLLKDVAAKDLSMNGIRSTVYSGLGPFYDNKISRFPDEQEEEVELNFDNENDPLILDFWDEWTTMASLVKCGYLRLYERVSTFWADQQDASCTTCYFYDKDNDACSTWQAVNVKDRMSGCPFWTKKSDISPEYSEVKADELKEPTWKLEYVPIEQRKEEHEFFRINQ